MRRGEWETPLCFWHYQEKYCNIQAISPLACDCRNSLPTLNMQFTKGNSLCCWVFIWNYSWISSSWSASFCSQCYTVHAQGEGSGPVGQGSGSEGTAEGQAGGDPRAGAQQHHCWEDQRLDCLIRKDHTFTWALYLVLCWMQVTSLLSPCGTWSVLRSQSPVLQLLVWPPPMRWRRKRNWLWCCCKGFWGVGQYNTRWVPSQCCSQAVPHSLWDAFPTEWSAS